MKHCLLFDSDGTLVDSETINTEALSDELAQHNVAEHKASLLARYRGWQFKAMLGELSQLHDIELTEQFEFSFRARASRYFADRLEPVAHIHQALSQLPHVKCVASNAPMDKLSQVLAKTELAKFFDGKLFSAYDLSCFKPDPGLFLHAAQQMGFDPEQCIVIEDSEVGVQASLAAGMKCILYKPDSGNHAHLEDPGVHSDVYNISSMRDLPAMIASIDSQLGATS